MNDRFFSLKLFVRVARTGSFSAAGRELGISQPSASRIIGILERQVGAALLTRTTRAVTLTEAGVDYLVSIEPILAALEEADHVARGTGELRGVLRVAASTTLAVREIIPRLKRFTDLHPKLRVEFTLSDHRQDLVSEGLDIALRVGTLTDSTAVSRKLGVTRRVVAASPEYLAANGTPLFPPDLENHSIIVGPASQGSEGWAFRKGGKATSIRVEGRFVMSNTEAVIAAAVAGLGVVSIGDLGFRQELAKGTLVRLLTDWEMGSGDVSAILPAGRAAKPSARAFAQFLIEDLKDLQERDV